MLKHRKDLEKYAVSIIKPLLDGNSSVWDPYNPIKGKAHWSGHFYTYLEMYARPLWTLPFILKNKKNFIYLKNKNQKKRIDEWYREGIVLGTDKSKKSYWGDYKVYGQMSTEVAPIALSLFWGREWFWDPLNNKEKRQIGDWLYKVAGVYPKKTHKNNHYWFPILINLALKRLGLRFHKNIIKESLKKLDEFYMGNGWFYDGTIGRYDYYIAWSHHLYPMLWIILEEENERGYKNRKEMYIERVNKFLKYYPFFFDSNGLHLPWGRSLSYRFASVGLLGLAVYNGCDINPGIAKSITLKNIYYFSKNGAEANKKVSPGFSYSSYQNVERYISVSSSYWLTKGFFSLIMDKHHKFWKSEEVKFPAERLNYFEYKIDIPFAHLKIVGEPKVNGITLYNNSCYIKIGGFGSTNEFYGKFVYNSRAGFGTSTRDWTSSDNMISLMTKDKLQTSHRAIYKDMGENNGVYYSEHIPFSNDKESLIKTALIPLTDGFHIRVHKIILSKPYIILEGGFSVGKNIDKEIVYKDNNWIAVTTDVGTSFLYTYSNTNLEFQVRKIHPDAHILYPLAVYPAYITSKEFPKGEYIFITVFFFTSKKNIRRSYFNKIINKMPEITLISNNKIVIRRHMKNIEIKI